MNKFPKRRRANGKNHLDPDEPLTESQAVEYANERGYPWSRNKLAKSRMDPPRCPGPKFRKLDGGRVEYTRRWIDEYMETHAPQIIDPAERIREAS